MSVKPQYETYRYTDEVAKLYSQSMVECRLSGSEIGSILAVQASAVPTECVCVDGEVRYKGKAVLCIVYEDGDGKICRAERGLEFYHKAESGEVTPACFAKTGFEIANVTHRREGSGLYVTVVIDAHSWVYGSKQVEYLIGGEGLTVKDGQFTVCKTVCVSGETEGEDEFETDYVGDILLHSENAVVTRMQASGGQIDIEGEIALSVCALKGDDSVCSYERIVPFTVQIPCEEAFGKVTGGARVQVQSATLTAGVDEDKGLSKVVFAYTLYADCYLSRAEELKAVADAFSTAYTTELERVYGEGRYLVKQEKYTERVGGSATFSAELESDYVLETAVLPRAEGVCRRTESGVEVEGVVTAEVFARNADGGRKSRTLSLPFVFPLPIEGESVEVDCAVCGLNVRRKNGGEVDAECTVKLSARSYDKQTWSYIQEARIGEEKPVCHSAVSVFMTREGEELWEIAKRLSKTPEELKSSNPELTFPVSSGQRIFVYRRIKGTGES